MSDAFILALTGSAKTLKIRKTQEQYFAVLCDMSEMLDKYEVQGTDNMEERFGE